MTPELSRRQLLQGAAGIGFIAVMTGCQGAPTVVPSDDHADDVGAVVQVGDNFYEPQHVTIREGQAVRWEWVGRERHDVVSNDRSFVSELMTDGHYVHVFSDAGAFSYYCSVHPEMRGLVTVQ